MTIQADVRVDLEDFQLEVAIDVATGQTLAVVGPNGSGKSTLISVLAGHVPISAGSIRLDGVEVDNPTAGIWVEPENRAVALVPQDGLLFPHLDVAANMRFGLRYRHPVADPDAAIAEALAAVELSDVLHRRPGELSGGQAQRVALARALALHQPVLLLDEPLSRVDVSNRRLLRRAIDELRPADQTQVIVTHGHDHARETDLVLALDRGKVVAIETPQKMAEDPPTAWLAELFQ